MTAPSNDAIDLIRDTVLAPPGTSPDREYVVLGGRLQVNAFLPLAVRRAAASALRRRTDETRAVSRFGRWCLAAGVESGLAARLVRTRVRLPAPGPGSLAAEVARLLDRDDVVLAGALGPVRPNLKPVVQVFDRDGSTLAFVKVGWNDLTRRLVHHEFEVLRSLHVRAPILVPSALGLVESGDHVGLVLSPLDLWHLRRRPRQPPSPAIVQTIAELVRPTVPGVVSESSFVRNITSLADDANLIHGPTLRRALDHLLAAFGSESLAFGTSHGDFSPWNTLRTGHQIAIWDWERSRDDVPVGIDYLHYVTQLQARRPIESLPSVATSDFAASRPALTALGVPARLFDPFVTLYYADLLSRYERDSQTGDAPGLTAMRDAVERALRARLDRNPRR